MEKFVPFDKLSKRKKREQLAKRRKTWGEISPVTRKPDNPKAYNRGEEKREKARRWNDDSSTGAPFLASRARTREERYFQFALLRLVSVK